MQDSLPELRSVVKRLEAHSRLLGIHECGLELREMKDEGNCIPSLSVGRSTVESYLRRVIARRRSRYPRSTPTNFFAGFGECLQVFFIFKVYHVGGGLSTVRRLVSRPQKSLLLCRSWSRRPDGSIRCNNRSGRI